MVSGGDASQQLERSWFRRHPSGGSDRSSFTPRRVSYCSFIRALIYYTVPKFAEGRMWLSFREAHRAPASQRMNLHCWQLYRIHPHSSSNHRTPSLHFSPIQAHISSRPDASTSVNADGRSESKSNTAMTLPVNEITGTTTSDSVDDAHAIWPGNSCTFGTSWVFWVLAAAPHTPLEKGILRHARLPWYGPITSSPGLLGSVK